MKNILSLLIKSIILSLVILTNGSFLYAQKLPSRTELPLVIVVCSYNNAPWVEKNLDSIFQQDYSNFRVIYVDDASEDETSDAVAQYRARHHLEDKLILWSNKERARKTKNVYNAFHSCDDNEIIVIVDGDDWLAHTQVFSQINHAYLYNDVWLTWGQFEMSDKSQATRGWSQYVPEDLIESNDFREFTWVYGAPRTFYAWLFKQIKIEDFIGLMVSGYQGKFYPSCDDFAMMYPMLEMAQHRIAFIPENAYIVNNFNPLSTSHVKPADPLVSMQTACEVKMYKKRYSALESPVTNVVAQHQHSKADAIIVSTSRDKTTALINTVRHQIKNIGCILVVHQETSNAINSSDVTYLKLPSSATDLKQAIAALPHDHLLLMHDTLTITQKIDCQIGIIDLERTGALGCYYQVHPKLLEQTDIPYQHVRDQLYAWKINLDGNHTIQEHGYDMNLYRKKDILDLITSQELQTITDFKQSMPRRSTNLHAVGLCYTTPCATAQNFLTKAYDRQNAHYTVVDFDKAMYATERHKEIYHEIVASSKEAAFVDILRKNYNKFFDNPPFKIAPKIPKIIHHIWLGGPMPEQYVLWRKKWQDMHPDWTFMLWTDKEVAHFHLENQEYYDETTSYGEKANLLRYELLYQFGGLYVDTDCECYKQFDFLHHCCDFYAGCEYPQRSYAGSRIMVGNSIMASRPGHPLVRAFIDGIQHTWQEEMQVARSGTRYATDIIKKMLPKARDVIMIFPANIFYPWATAKNPWEEPITDQETFVQPESWSLHYWHFTWNKRPQKEEKRSRVQQEEQTYYKKQKVSENKKKKPKDKRRILKKREFKG
ncbi:MAG: glycosyltransferase [Candidatus Babeliales bacterium]